MPAKSQRKQRKPMPDELLQPGKKIRLHYSDGNVNNKVLEVRAVVDEDYIVVRTWRETRKDHRYYVEHRAYFDVHYDGGNMWEY